MSDNNLVPLTDEQLELCPFCGNRAAIFYNNAYDKHFVECDSCLARGPAEDDDIIARESWNRRVDSAGGEGK